jgi:cyclophilin family peptidyl-prolyl cis-trans isomerase
MRLLKFVAGMTGLMMAGLLAAQQPPPSELPPQPTSYPPPPPALEADNTWNLDLSTGGRVSIQLRADVAPNHVERIKALTRRGFYNGLAFHRVIEGFMAQGGDPSGDGTGGSDLPDMATEVNGLPHVRGAVAMARSQAIASANSQFYIMLAPRLVLDRNYTVFGRVVSGIQFVDTIERGEPAINPTRIIRASIGSDNVPPMTAEELRAAAAQLTANAATGQAQGQRRLLLGPAVPPPPAIRMPDPPQPQRRPRRPQQ